MRMGNIQNGQLVADSLKFLPMEHEEFPELLLKPGDLLFNRTNSFELVGKTAVYSGTPERCSFASYLIRVRFLGEILPEFVGYVINSVYGREWISSVVSQQVVQANVNGTKLKAFSVPLSSLEE
jgi:type I restriction enzyme, S subunit